MKYDRILILVAGLFFIIFYFVVRFFIIVFPKLLDVVDKKNTSYYLQGTTILIQCFAYDSFTTEPSATEILRSQWRRLRSFP